MFTKSESFKFAGYNAWLLVKIAGYLSPTQWKNILEAFFENDEIHNSNDCYEEFESLFIKSLGLSNSVEDYWLSFREKLDKLDNPRYVNQYRNSLKELIDLHLVTDEF